MEDSLQFWRSRERIQSGGDEVGGRNMRLCTAFNTADGRWLTSLDVLRPTADDSQFGVGGFGLTNENVIADTNILLGEGVGGNWTSQSGGSG
jgi:hypothetical protein